MKYLETLKATGASRLLLLCGATCVFGQAPVIQGVFNAGSNDTRLCPGVVANLAGDFGGAKATVLVGGKPAYIFYNGAKQLVVQIPMELSAGTTAVTVATTAGTSAPFNATLDAYAPALFSADSSGKGMGSFTDVAGNTISSQNTAHAGEAVTIVATGLGPTNPPVATGKVASVPSPTAQLPTVTVAGKPAQVSFSGVAASNDISLIGTYRITFIVPLDAPSANDDVVVRIGGKTSNTVTLPVKVQLPVVSAVVNGASFAAQGPIVPGSFASVFVSNIGTTDNVSVFPATTFSGVSVTFNGTAAPLFHVLASAGQINLLVPSELPESGTLNLQVRTAGGDTVAFPVQMAAAAPGIFRIGTNAAAQISGSAWIPMPASLASSLGIATNCAASGVNPASTCAQAAAPGDYLTFYVTGLGKATPEGDPNGSPVATGKTAPADGNPLYKTVLTPQITVAGLPVAVFFSGLTPGYAGLYQVNFRVPDNAPDGDAVPIVISMGGNVDTATIAIRRK